MADQNKENEVEDKAAAGAADAVSEQAFDNFHKELSSDREASALNSLGNQIKNSSSDGNGAKNSNEHESYHEKISRTIKESGSLSDLLKSDKPREKEQMIADAIQKVGEITKPWDNNNHIGDILKHYGQRDGVKPLPTGDYLVREDGKETVFTPSGDRVTVNPDGTSAIKGNVKSVETNKRGETTVTFADGGKVSYDKEGITNVSRGNNSVSFPRLDNRRPDFWPDKNPGNWPDKWPNLKEDLKELQIRPSDGHSGDGGGGGKGGGGGGDRGQSGGGGGDAHGGSYGDHGSGGGGGGGKGGDRGSGGGGGGGKGGDRGGKGGGGGGKPIYLDIPEIRIKSK